MYNDSIFLHCDQLSLNHFANNSEEIHDDEPILFEPFCKQKSQPLICVQGHIDLMSAGGFLFFLGFLFSLLVLFYFSFSRIFVFLYFHVG